VTRVLLLRHARTTANSAGVLAGWTPGTGLDDTGRAQAEQVAARIGALPIARIVSSPLQRCAETLAPLLSARPELAVVTDPRVGEVEYGDWTGRELKSLAREPLWKVVQAHPSAAVFPAGESLAAMQARAVTAVREHAAEVGDELLLVCSHGDVIKAILADALAMHLDAFQRIVADPASVSVIDYTPLRPFVRRVNDTGSDLSGLAVAARRRRRGRSSDAAVGGGSGG
jgi:probable phosphomutase (TIGR03848 family)